MSKNIPFFTKIPEDIYNDISVTSKETGKRKEQITKEAFLKYFGVK